MSYLSALQAGAFSGGTFTTPSLSEVLLAGATASDNINMAQFDLNNVDSITNATSALKITAPVGLSLSGSVGTAGQVLSSNAGAQPTWLTIPSALTGTTIASSNVEVARITNANYLTIPAMAVGWYLFTCSQAFYAYDPAVGIIPLDSQYFYLTNNSAVAGNFLPAPTDAGVRYSASMPKTTASEILYTPISFIFYNDNASEDLFLGTQGNCAVVLDGVVRGALTNTKLVKLI